MKTIEEKISKNLDVTPDKAWEVIGAIGGVDRWFSSLIKTCSVANGKRFCQTIDGTDLVEDILEVNHETKTFRFAIPQQTMLPVEDIVETMTVRNDGNGKSIVDWSASFKATPENGEIAKEAFKNLWNTGLQEMETYINQNL
ncbi:SRPBCC family protein [Spongiimicrobium sp. 2-473A-2-J]|uniref:SRPBCC family protein n=1 Tax=Eudoraea algarum TaxID=3417568 RepID=UPI003D36E9F8